MSVMQRERNRKSAIENFRDDKVFLKILNSVYKKDMRISNTNVRTRCASWGNNTPYNFKPLVAKYIYDTYMPKNGVCLDPCSGFGGRLLGLAASSLNDKFYVGVEPESVAIENSQRMCSDLNIKHCHIYNNCYEDFVYDLGKNINIIFTSPPYYNKELYNVKNPLQSHVRYSSYPEWRYGFLHSLIHKSYDLLEDDGFFIIAIDDIPDYPIVEDFLKDASSIWELVKTYNMHYNVSPFKTEEEKENTESIFVFKKRIGNEQ